jgi:arylsulfatase A-like enzyme
VAGAKPNDVGMSRRYSAGGVSLSQQGAGFSVVVSVLVFKPEGRLCFKGLNKSARRTVRMRLGKQETAMKTIFIMMDSLNRHHMRLYGGGINTPNIDRLARRGIVFDNHYCGSLPCMPARREMMTGRLNFLEAPWGALEPWDDCLPLLLKRQKNVYSHLITDHYHYFHFGGEMYHEIFSSWEFIRGQENDTWKPLINVDSSPAGVRGKGVGKRAYWANRKFMDPEKDEDYPTPQCFMQAMDFLKINHQADNWHLHLEVFDPHEPFDCPKKYRDMFGDKWDKPDYTWPLYGKLDPVLDDKAAVEHIRKCYAGTLAMADTWLGRFLDVMDRYDMWKDTTVIFSTDHGHLLGEHGLWAKNLMFAYNELAHIPLIVCSPIITKAREGSRVKALTATIDLMPTFMALHGAKLPPHVQGKSLIHLLEKDGVQHDAVLYGYFGKDVNMTDGKYSYCRQPASGSAVYFHTSMPTGFFQDAGREELAKAQTGLFLKNTYGIPDFRIARQSSRHDDAPDFHPVYDLEKDPCQTTPVRDEALERRLAGKMTELLKRYDAQECQYKRLGLQGSSV